MPVEDRRARPLDQRLVGVVHLEHAELALDEEDAGLDVGHRPSARSMTRSIARPGATSTISAWSPSIGG